VDGENEIRLVRKRFDDVPQRVLREPASNELDVFAGHTVAGVCDPGRIFFRSRPLSGQLQFNSLGRR
jgi:hypothetical protein